MKKGLLGLVCLLAAACGGSADPTMGAAATTTTASQATSTTTPPPTTPQPRYRGFDETSELEGTLVVILGEEIPVFASPGDPEPKLVMPATTILGTTTVLATTGPPEDGWVEVMLPMRPNGSTGWVVTDDIAMYVVDGRIEVDLSDRELVYIVDGQVLLTTRVAVGTERNPTPPGTYFVTDNVRIKEGTGPWGPAALGLSARSDTITEFNGGDGIVGIHGTNRPGSIGQAASLGCVRLPNDVILELHELVPIGTPVEISA